jgi:hypothetical protein
MNIQTAAEPWEFCTVITVFAKFLQTFFNSVITTMSYCHYIVAKIQQGSFTVFTALSTGMFVPSIKPSQEYTEYKLNRMLYVSTWYTSAKFTSQLKYRKHWITYLKYVINRRTSEQKSRRLGLVL